MRIAVRYFKSTGLESHEVLMCARMVQITHEAFRKFDLQLCKNVEKKFETLVKAAGLLAPTGKILRQLAYPTVGCLKQFSTLAGLFVLTQRNRDLLISLNPCRDISL
jgi:hypothetical protein